METRIILYKLKHRKYRDVAQINWSENVPTRFVDLIIIYLDRYCLHKTVGFFDFTEAVCFLALTRFLDSPNVNCNFILKNCSFHTKVKKLLLFKYWSSFLSNNLVMAIYLRIQPSSQLGPADPRSWTPLMPSCYRPMCLRYESTNVYESSIHRYKKLNK